MHFTEKTINRRKLKRGMIGKVSEFRRKIKGTNILVEVPQDGIHAMRYDPRSGEYVTCGKKADFRIAMNGDIELTRGELVELLEELLELTR